MLNLINSIGRTGQRFCKLPDLELILKDLSKLDERSNVSEYLYFNIKLDNAFDFVLSHNIDNLDALRNYFSQKECLNDLYL